MAPRSTSRTRRGPVAAGLLAVALLAVACSDDGATSSTGDTTAATVGATDSTDGTAPVVGDADRLGARFDDGALTEAPVVVECTLEDGTATTCYRLTVPSQPDTVETGPFCPDTVDDPDHGIFTWDGDEPGLYALDAAFWAMLAEQGYAFTDDDGTVHVTDPASGGPPAEDTCLQATPDGSFTLQVLLPTDPVLLDEPTSLDTGSQIGLALDGVTIFGDAPSGTTGAIPALDPCGGHDDPSGYYHWHFGSSGVQEELDAAGVGLTCAAEQHDAGLVGFAYDGFPIYGTLDADDSEPSDLDDCHGHVGDTDLGETYHYHLVHEAPNLPPCRVGAAAEGKLTSPDNPSASLPDSGGPGGAGGPGGPGGPPPGG